MGRTDSKLPYSPDLKVRIPPSRPQIVHLMPSRIRAAQRKRSQELSKGALEGIKAVPIGTARSTGHALTPRQIDVLRELAMGQGVKAIGLSLGISPKTVETHRQNLMKRLRIAHVPRLVRYALRSGVLSPTWFLKDD